MLRERQQMLTLARVGNAVQREQVGYVALLEADAAMLDPADLGPGRPDLITCLVRRDPGRLAQAAQLGSEQDPQYRGAAGGICQGWLRVTRTRIAPTSRNRTSRNRTGRIRTRSGNLGRV